MFSFPISLTLGVIGIIFDRRKWVAIGATIIAAGLVLVHLFAMVITFLHF